jgi:hypothetical protein
MISVGRFLSGPVIRLMYDISVYTVLVSNELSVPDIAKSLTKIIKIVNSGVKLTKKV